MGYRSDVRIRTTKEGFEYLKNKMDSILFNFAEITNEKDGAVTMDFKDIKWYEGCDGYEDITEFMGLISDLQLKDIDYQYMRIGEEYDDIDELYSVNNDSFETFYLQRYFEG